MENKYKIKLMTSDDIEEVLLIRNHKLVYPFLHTPRKFSIKEGKLWMKNTKPLWFCIWDKEKIIGYIRTSNLDYINKKLMIGCDIHPSYRNKGIATFVYKYLFKELEKRMWREIHLKVLKYNKIAIYLYKKLGFEKYLEKDDSLFLKKIINKNVTNYNVKVISCYFGDRRKFPYKAKQIYKMYKYLWVKEQTIDHGCPMDIIFVHNKAYIKANKNIDKDTVSNINDYNKCVNFLFSFNNKKTKNGMSYVVERENIGLSFGAYDYAFNKFKKLYDFWFFTEDDIICIKENVLKQSMEDIMDIKNIGRNIISFVGSVGIDKRYNSVHGGCGVSNREYLSDICDNNYSSILGRGSLPFWNVLTRGYCNGKHEEEGEIKFTNKHVQMGYILEENKIKKSILRYGYLKSRKLSSPCKHYSSKKIDKEIHNYYNKK